MAQVKSLVEARDLKYKATTARSEGSRANVSGSGSRHNPR